MGERLLVLMICHRLFYPPKCCLFPNHTITGLYRVECERFAVTGRSNHANHGDEAFHPYVAALSGRPNTQLFPFSSTAPPIVCSKVGLSVTKKVGEKLKNHVG